MSELERFNQVAEPQRVTAAELKRRLDGGAPIAILDTRSFHAWDKSDVQLPGSIRVPPDEIGRVVRFLVSDESAPTSGAGIPVYGRA